MVVKDRLNKSYEKEKPNALGKIFGANFERNYGLVEVRVKGQAQLGGNSMMAGFMSGNPSSTRAFNSRIKYQLYQREDGLWIARY